MPDSFPCLPLGDYVFLYQSNNPGAPDEFPAALWHSVFGNALHQRVCIAPDTACDNCLLLHQCDYTFLFNSRRPPQAGLMRKYSTIPPPHVLLSPPSPVTIDPRQELYALRLALIGTANDKLPLVIRVLAEAGLRGLGRQKRRLHLLEVTQMNPGGGLRPILANQRFLDEGKPEIPQPPAVPDAVQIHLKTPYIPSGNRKPLPQQFDLAHFLMAIIRRIDLMQYFYTGKKLQADFKHLKALTQTIPCTDVRLETQQGVRYSSAAGTGKPLSGLTGQFVLATGKAKALWPYLHLGQWLNLGKNASMGYGRYELEEVGYDGLPR